MLQIPLLRQFTKHIAYMLNLQEKADDQNITSLYSTTDSLRSFDDNDSLHETFRYAPSSIYSADSFDEREDRDCADQKTDSSSNSVFEKTYVSFPEFTSSNTTNRMLFTMPEVMTATATPMFCNQPHSKPIWIA